MAHYLESKRIPPERLMSKQPENYDRTLKTTDIEGAKANVKPINQAIHGNSLKTDDIQGAKPKLTIRNIWKEKEYNPTDRNAQLPSQTLPFKQTLTDPLQYSSQNVAQQVRHLSKETMPHDPYSNIENKPTYNQQPQPQQQLQQQQQQYYSQQQPVSQVNEQNNYNQNQSNQQQNVSDNKSFQKDYDNFYRGYTPNAETVKQYPVTQNNLQKKAAQISSKAQQIEKQMFSNDDYQKNIQAFYGKTPQSYVHSRNHDLQRRSMNDSNSVPQFQEFSNNNYQFQQPQQQQQYQQQQYYQQPIKTPMQPPQQPFYQIEQTQSYQEQPQQYLQNNSQTQPQIQQQKQWDKQEYNPLGNYIYPQQDNTKNIFNQDMGGIQQQQQQTRDPYSNKFGRSNLFADQPQGKINLYANRNYTHGRDLNFDVNNNNSISNNLGNNSPRRMQL